MRKKKKTQKQMEYEHEFMMKKYTSDIADLYPAVTRIDCSFLFKDPDHLVPDFTRERTFLPKEKAWFKIECPNRECVGGGLKLEPELLEMLRNRETHKEGRILCRGWSDQERINQYPCHYELHYTINVQYSDG